MVRPKLNLAGVFLSGVTGMTLAGVSLLAYIRFEHPQQFAETSVRMSRPEFADEATKKWGVFGTGLGDAIPQSIKNLFWIDNLPERIELQKKKHAQQIRDSIEELRPKDK